MRLQALARAAVEREVGRLLRETAPPFSTLTVKDVVDAYDFHVGSYQYTKQKKEIGEQLVRNVLADLYLDGTLGKLVDRDGKKIRRDNNVQYVPALRSKHQYAHLGSGVQIVRTH